MPPAGPRRPRLSLLERSPQLTLFRSGAAVAGLLPGSVARTIAEVAGVAAARVPGAARGPLLGGMGARRALAASHLRRVYGPELSERELGRRVDEAFASYARYWAESLRLPSLTVAEVEAGMSFRGFHHVDEALAGGRGAIVALPHLGGWDWGGTFLAGSGYDASVVVEALDPPDVFEWFASFRRSLGLEVIPVGPGAGAACMAALRANRILCLLSDRVVASTPSIEVELFGGTTRLPAGPATLALRTGAPILPTAIYFGRGASEHLALIRPPLPVRRTGGFRADVAAVTRDLAGELEGLIRRAPTQWHLMSPAWPGDEAVLAAAGGT